MRNSQEYVTKSKTEKRKRRILRARYSPETRFPAAIDGSNLRKSNSVRERMRARIKKNENIKNINES